VSEPRAEYEKRLKGHEQALAACEARHVWVGNAKLAVIAAGLAMAWFVWARHAFDLSWLLAPAAAYLALAVMHEMTLRKRRAEESAVALYRRGIARIQEKNSAKKTMCTRMIWICLAEGACLSCFRPRGCRWASGSLRIG